MKPNIVLIHLDQLRYDCLGYLGAPQIETPAIDGLAREGVRYTNSFCPFPVCTPSRYSLLTGRMPNHHRGLSNHSTPLQDVPALPAVLRAHGYHTQCVGKMHFTPTYLDIGFSRMLLAEQEGPGRYDDDYHRYLMSQGLCDINDMLDQVQPLPLEIPQRYRDSFGAVPSNLPEEHHSTTWIGRNAVELIRGWTNAPHFLMVGFIKPHRPFDPPKEWAARYRPETLSPLPGWCAAIPEADRATAELTFPNGSLDTGRLRQVMAMYYASITQIDRWVADIIEALKQKGVYEKTMILFTSDHGEFMGFHHLLGKMGHLYDALVRVPLIIKYPSQKQGREDKRLVSNIDLAPTILECAGLSVPAHMEGSPLSRPDKRPLIFAQNAFSYMVRGERYKLIWYPGENRYLFFDLLQDPQELDDLYPKSGQLPVLRQYQERLLSEFPSGRLYEAHLDEAAAQARRPAPPESRQVKEYLLERIKAAN